MSEAPAGTASVEDAILQHLAAYEVNLEGWRLRAHQLEKPEPGSELFQDDTVFRYHPISDAARLCLTSAGEHLRLAWTAIKAGELYPTAHFTALRGALVASAQAVYVLGPGEAQIRRGRGLAVIVESYTRLRQFHRMHLDLPELTEAQKGAVEHQLTWLQGRIDQAKSAGADKNGLKMTQAVIPYAAQLVYAHDKQKAHLISLQWSQMSGDAHALGWAPTLRAVLDQPKNGELLTTGIVQGSLRDIAQPFESSYRLLKRGWSLFDQRCERA